MLAKTNVQKALEKFRDQVVRQSKANLTRQGKNVTRKLYNSIDGEVFTGPNSIGIYFEMDEHGSYVDQGVKGAVSTSKAPNSPYRFGSGTGKKGGLTKGIGEWVKKKRFQFRNPDGTFMSYKSMTHIIARSIYRKGIKPSLFFTKAFENAYKKLPDEIVESFGLDIDKEINNALNGK